MPYQNQVVAPNVVGNFFAGQQAAQQDAVQGLQMQRAQRLNALAANPAATPEQYARAGDAQTGMALQTMNQQGQVDKQQAVQQMVGIAQKALTITDPVQRKNFLQQAGQLYAPSFQALGADMSQFPAMLQMPDDQLDQRLKQVAQLAAPQKPIEVAAGGTLAVQDPTNPGKYTTAFTNPKDNEITPYQKAQLDIERQKLAQGQTANQLTNETKQQNIIGKLRDDYTGIVKSTGWPDQQGFYQRLKTVANDKTGASDLALVFSYMKVLDPTSAVREGEYANAANTGGVPDWVIAKYNKILDGEILAPTQRSNFINAADKIYKTAFQRQESIRKDFSSKAARAGVNPQDVLVDFGAPQPAADNANAPVPTATGPNGQKLYLRGGQWVPQ